MPPFVWNFFSPHYAMNDVTLDTFLTPMPLRANLAERRRDWRRRCNQQFWQEYFMYGLTNRVEILRKCAFEPLTSPLNMKHKRSLAVHPQGHCFVGRVDCTDMKGGDLSQVCALRGHARRRPFLGMIPLDSCRYLEKLKHIVKIHVINFKFFHFFS